MIRRGVQQAAGQARNCLRKPFSSVAVAHSSWFRLEDQGMKDYELLARGSGFFVHGPNTGATIAVVSAHVAAPHRFPRYFPQEWLKHVQDSDCRTMLETRSKDGTVVTGSVATIPLAKGFRHSTLDVAAFLLDDDTIPSNADTCILQLADESDEPQLGSEVVVAGFRLIGESGSGTEAVVPTQMNGSISELVKARGFINTGQAETEMGMCGGPIVSVSNRNNCVGILEGLVPRIDANATEVNEMHRKISGHSVFISSNELHKFLHDVESEHARKDQADNNV